MALCGKKGAGYFIRFLFFMRGHSPLKRLFPMASGDCNRGDDLPLCSDVCFLVHLGGDMNRFREELSLASRQQVGGV